MTVVITPTHLTVEVMAHEAPQTMGLLTICTPQTDGFLERLRRCVQDDLQRIEQGENVDLLPLGWTADGVFQVELQVPGGVKLLLQLPDAGRVPSLDLADVVVPMNLRILAATDPEHAHGGPPSSFGGTSEGTDAAGSDDPAAPFGGAS